MKTYLLTTVALAALFASSSVYPAEKRATKERPAKASKEKAQGQQKGTSLAPTHANVSYGPDESNVLDGGDNMTEVEVPATGTYRFEFDYSLLRSRIILVK